MTIPCRPAIVTRNKQRGGRVERSRRGWADDDQGVVRPSTQANVILAGAIAVAIAAPFYGPVRRILGTAPILMLCFLLQGIGITVMGLTHGSEFTALGCFVLGIGTGISNPLISDLIVGHTTPELRSKAIGVSYTARYGGDFLNPWIMRPMAALIGLHRAFIVLGALFLAGVGIAAIVRQTVGNRSKLRSRKLRKSVEEAYAAHRRSTISRETLTIFIPANAGTHLPARAVFAGMRRRLRGFPLSRE